MLVCLDVAYHPAVVTTACVALRDFRDAAPLFERTLCSRRAPDAYVPGEFFRRELPFLLEAVPPEARLVIIDGYVWLGPGRDGLGAHLHRETGLAVVGVAKSLFRGGVGAIPVARGAGSRPIYVTAAGIDVVTAAAEVRAMAGAHRIPSALQRADSLCRSVTDPSCA